MKRVRFLAFWLAAIVVMVCRPATSPAVEIAPLPSSREDSPETPGGGESAASADAHERTLVVRVNIDNRSAGVVAPAGSRAAKSGESPGDPPDGPPGAGEDGEPMIVSVNLGSRSVRVVPRDEFNRFAGSTAMRDGGIDPADVRWKRQARTTGMRMRMLNGPEGMLGSEPVSSNTEKGARTYAGAVVPLNPRWELAVINIIASFKLKETGRDAGLDALRIRLGANPSVSFRPWLELTPYAGLGERDGGGLGLAGGLSKSWASGISLEGEAYAWQPWDEGYETARNDGRSHGIRLRGTLPVTRRLTLSGEAGHEWLELGPNAPGGRENAGRRGTWQARAEYMLLKRDGCYMGYGFRDQILWSEQLVPVELGLFADVQRQRYIRPDGFTALNPEEKSWRQRVGIFYYQAVSPKIGFAAEAFVGQDADREIDAGDLYGVAVRLNLVLTPRLRVWGGWGYESSSGSLSGGGGPNRNFSVGLNWNF
ncbi:MAG: hypothetical protein LBS30_04075 [Planctomycetota bacterium]|jgi:hypothetical protein|nr:hypothetical protein [Planctomycetota bacterium]